MQLISTFCDLCFTENDEHTPSDGSTLIEINGRGIEVDLCTKHSEMLTTMLEPYYDAGRRPERVRFQPKPKPLKPSKVTSGSYTCDFEPCDRSFGTSQGLAMHRTRTHGAHGLADLNTTQNLDREVDGENSVDRKRRRDRERYAQRKVEDPERFLTLDN